MNRLANYNSKFPKAWRDRSNIKGQKDGDRPVVTQKWAHLSVRLSETEQKMGRRTSICLCPPAYLHLLLHMLSG